jgi:hypothetical protein
MKTRVGLEKYGEPALEAVERKFCWVMELRGNATVMGGQCGYVIAGSILCIHYQSIFHANSPER